MSEKKESQRKTQKEMQLEIVNFLHIDTNKITFKEPKSNKYNGSQIGILYNGMKIFVRYEGVTPFGLKENFDKMVTTRVPVCKLIVKENISEKLEN